MKAAVRYGVLAIVMVAGLAVLAYSFSGTLLYTLSPGHFPSSYHVNTNAYKAQELNSTTDVLPLMQDLLDYSGPIVLNIRAGDVEGAKRDLAAYAKTRRSFENLVVKLDMSESEIEEFAKSQENQNMVLAELLNSSVALDQLASLEVQYRSENNPAMLSTIRLQGDALRAKITTLADEYQAEAGTSVAIGKKAGLDTGSEEESTREVREYAEEVSTVRQQQADVPIRRSSQLSLLVYPDTGRYGDTIRCFGYYFSQYGYRIASTPNKPVTLYLDETAIGTVTTDETGSYTLEFPINRVEAGEHLLHAESGTTESLLRSFTIVPVDSVTTLTVTPTKTAGVMTCTGAVTANIPVRNAPVEILCDGIRVNRTATGQAGDFKATLNLSAGVHSVQAQFTGTGYPIAPSESEIQTVIVPPAAVPFDYRIFLLFIVFVIFGLAGAGALWYTRRAPGGRGPSATAPAVGPEAETEVERPVPDLPELAPPAGPGAPSGESLEQRYAALLSAGGLDAASHTVYCDLATRLARDQKIRRHRALTPREMARSCRKRPYCGPFSRLVAAYERIRYGGSCEDTVREEFEQSLQHTDARMRGEDH